MSVYGCAHNLKSIQKHCGSSYTHKCSLSHVLILMGLCLLFCFCFFRGVLFLQHVCTVAHRVTLTTPYKAGYLAFREVAHYVALLQAMRQNQPAQMPDVVLVDGQGSLHYRRKWKANRQGFIILNDGCSTMTL